MQTETKGSRREGWINLQVWFEKLFGRFFFMLLWVSTAIHCSCGESSLIRASVLQQTSYKATFQVYSKDRFLLSTHTHRGTNTQADELFPDPHVFFSLSSIISITLWTRIPRNSDWRHNSRKAPSQTATWDISNCLFSSPPQPPITCFLPPLLL